MKKKLYNYLDAIKLKKKTVLDKYSLFSNSSQQKIFNQFPFNKSLFEKAKGIYLYKKNKKIIDFTGGFGVLGLGHNNRDIIKARIDFQKSLFIEVNKIYYTKFFAALSHNLSQLFPQYLNKSFFCNSGAEAVEGALKTAYKYYNGKNKFILHSNRSYHGKLIASGTISASYKSYLFPQIKNTVPFEFNNINSLEKNLKKIIKDKNKTCCVIVETFSASTLEELTDDFITNLEKLKKKYNFLIIVDEVFSGFYKSRNIFHFMKYKNFVPDLVTISKSLGGGKSSISAFICKENIFKNVYEKFNDTFLHTTTYNGFGEECATAVQATYLFGSTKYQKKAIYLSDYVLKKSREFCERNSNLVLEFKGTGLLNGFFFKTPFDLIIKIMRRVKIGFIEDKITLLKKIYSLAVSFELYNKHKILTYVNETGRSNHLVLAIPLIAQKKHIDYFFKSLERVLKKSLNRQILSIIINFLRK